LFIFKSDLGVEALLVESSMLEKLRNTNREKYAKDMDEAKDRLSYIIQRNKDNLINVFQVNTMNGGQDIELTILTAFLKCKLR
jgi:hypothetical protein